MFVSVSLPSGFTPCAVGRLCTPRLRLRNRLLVLVMALLTRKWQIATMAVSKSVRPSFTGSVLNTDNAVNKTVNLIE